MEEESPVRSDLKPTEWLSIDEAIDFLKDNFKDERSRLVFLIRELFLYRQGERRAHLTNNEEIADGYTPNELEPYPNRCYVRCSNHAVARFIYALQNTTNASNVAVSSEDNELLVSFDFPND